MTAAGRIARREQRAIARSGLVEMPLRYRREIAAGRRQRRMPQDLKRFGRADAVPFENLARQIQPAAPRVLVEIAQDVGQLQGAAERIGDRVRVGARIAEHMHRQMPDRGGDARAIQVERRQVRSADVLDCVHFHAVDNGVEVLASQAIT